MFQQKHTARFFASIKQIAFRENSTDAGDLRYIHHFISLCTERGLGLLGGLTFSFVIDPLGNC